jgi:hypothetical protein
MRSPARAFAWEFRRRHRWGLIALAGYLIILGTIKLLILGPGFAVHLDSPQSFAFVVVIPLTATFTYFLALFSFGLSGDLAARHSIYPARLFTLPVTTAALAGWPMLYGTAAMTLLWIATRLLALWPSGIAVPVIWPALLAAALLAWTQALTWMPYGLPGLRVIVTVLWLAVIDTVALVALQYNASEPVMVAMLAPQVPLAYLAARVAVARARRGDVPDWRVSLVRRRIAAVLPAPARAQRWFEWRRHGRSLPALVGILVPFELALLFLAGDDAPALVLYTLLGVLLTPPFMAIFAAATVSTATPFLATRPLTSAALIAAKLNMTVRSTLAAWLLVVLAVPLALALSGTWPVVIARASRVIETVGAPRAVVLLLLGISGLVAVTWKQLVQGLYLGLSGRAWAVKGSVFLTLSFLFFLGPIVQWISDDSDVQWALWDALPLILALAVCVKMSAAAWIATRLYHSRLVSDRTLVTGAALWCGVVLGLYGVLVWLLATPFFPRYLLVLVAILAIPLARLSAAPLALAWHRHR